MRLRNKILLATLGGAIITALGLYLTVFHFGLLEYIVNRKLKNLIGNNLPVRVQIGEIGGDFYSHLVLSDVNISYDDGKYSYLMAAIPRITTEYSFNNLWRGLLIFQKVIVDSAELTIRGSVENKWLIPKPRKESEQKASAVDFEIKELALNNLNLSFLRPGDSLVFKDVCLKTRLAAGDKTYSADIDTLSFKSTDSRFNLNSARGKVTLTGDNLMFQDISVLTDSSDIKFGGQLLLEEGLYWKIILEANRINFAEASSFINAGLTGNVRASGEIIYRKKRISGNVRVAGDFMNKQFDSLDTRFQFLDNKLTLDTLNGFILGGCRIAGKGDIDFGTKPEQYHLVGEISDFNLDKLVGGTFVSRLNGRINLSGSGFKSENLILDIMADLDESWFDQYHAYKAVGEMIITSDSILLRDQFAILYHNNTFIVSGKLEYSGLIDLTGTTRFDDLSAFSGQTFIDTLGGRADLNFQVSGEIRNPDIWGELSSDSLWLYGVYSSRATIDFWLQHFLYDREGDVKLNLFEGVAYNIPFDTIKIKMTVDSQIIHIDSARGINKYAVVSGRGALNYASYPQKLTFNKLAIEIMGLALANDSLVRIDIDSAGFNLTACRLLRPSGYIEGTGRINNDESMDLTVNVNRLNIVPFVRLIDDTLDLSGSISAQSHIQGTFQSPRFALRGTIDSLAYEKLVLGDLFADFRYADSMISIDSVTLKNQTGYYVARGTLPVNLSFIESGERFTANEQNIDITASDLRLDIISLFLDEVESLKGEFRADFKLTGTLLKPKIDGKASLNEATLKLYDLVLPLENLHIEMRMVDEIIYIEDASAVCKEGKKTEGTLSGEGQIIINSINQFDYNVKIKVKNFPARYELGDASAVVDADLKIYGVTPPTVYGDVRIISALYRENFTKESDGWVVLTSLQGDKTWDLNLNVEAASNLWIKNDDIDAEFAGALNFIREKGNYRYIGTLEILRGKGYLADRMFQIESGGTINYEDIEYPNPRLDLYASTKIRGSVTDQTGETESSSFELRVYISGTLDEPIISAAEGSTGSPQFTTEEIIPLIFTNYYQEGSGGALKTSDRVGDRLTTGLSGYLSSQATQIGSRTLGVETFEIDPVYGDKFNPLGTRLMVGFYTHPNLYIYGRSAISGISGREVGFEYRLKRFLLVEGRRDEENLYHLLLNFYWEY